RWETDTDTHEHEMSTFPVTVSTTRSPPGAHAFGDPDSSTLASSPMWFEFWLPYAARYALPDESSATAPVAVAVMSLRDKLTSPEPPNDLSRFPSVFKRTNSTPAPPEPP